MKTYIFLILLVGALFSSCSEADFPVPEASTIDAKYSVQLEGQTVTFINETRVAENAGTVKYAWDFGDRTSSTEEQPVHTYAKVGIYRVRLVVTADDDVDFYELSVAVIGSLNVEIYFANGGQGTLNRLPGNDVVFDTEQQIFGVDYDSTNSKVYYSSSSAGTLSRSDLDGENVEVLIEGIQGARDLALDLDNQKVYVVARGSNQILAYDMLADTSKVLYSTANGLGQLPEAIDYYNGFIYATCVDVRFESVYKGKIDGTGIENIIDFGAGGFGYGLAIDKTNEKIYFDNNDANQILMADLDGTNITSIVNTVGRAYGIVADPENGLIYWSDDGDRFIKKANLDGSEAVPVSLVLSDPLGIFFIP